MTAAQALYRNTIASARALLQDDPAILGLLHPDIEPAVLHRFLIEFSARGVQITRPVDGWIRRAGERCIEVGMEELGRQLVLHSKHEAGHHEMLVQDTRSLVARWNDQYVEKLDADALLAQGETRSMKDYLELHEETIASEAPFGQVAIELEIEGMSVSFGPRLVAQCRRVLGESVTAGLSFIHEHVEVDVGHTALNQALMDRLLVARPEAAEQLAAMGARALRAYVSFFGDCLKLAQAALDARPFQSSEKRGWGVSLRST